MAIGRVPGATGIQPSIVDAKGDLIAATAADSVSRLAVGSNNQVLMADSAQATGLKYANEATATLTTTGDLLYASAANTPARLGIGSTDQVLKVSGGIPAWGASPSPSFVGCRLDKSAAQTITTGVWTALTFDVEDYDTDGFHSNVTNNSRITIPSGKSGYYLIQCQISWVGNATGYRLAYNDVNGSGNAVYYYTWDPATLTGTLMEVWSFIDYFTAGDYIQVNVNQNSGGNLNVLGRNYSNFATTFQATFLGA